MSDLLKKEFEFYLAHQDELVSKHNGKFLAIKDCSIIGVYDTENEAISKTMKDHDLGTFIIQKCSPGDLDTTTTLYSRVFIKKPANV